MDARLGGGSETVTLIEPVRVGRCQGPATEALKLGMPEHAPDQEPSEAAAAVGRLDVYVGEIRVGRAVGDGPGESSLLTRRCIEPERE